MNSKIIFYAVMCILSCIQMPVYCYYKVRGKGKAYTISKCAGSAIFLLTAVLSVFFAKADIYTILVIISMVLSGVGDYLLSRTAAHRLKIGGGVFMAAHICFISAFIYAAGFHWQVIPIVAIMFIAELCVAKLIKLKTRGASKDMAIYIAVVTIMAVCAAAMLLTEEYRVPMNVVSRNMTMIGAVLFLVSDCIWMTYGMIFSSSKAALKIANVLTYFPAQMLIAGALIFR